MELGLVGKTAIITGGSGGIGQGMVLAFAKSGINTVSASRDIESGRKLEQVAAEKGYQGKVLAIKTDVTDRANVDAMVEQTRKEFGPVDYLINNAGGASHPCEFEDLKPEDTAWEVDVNINGVINCCQAVVEDMVGRSTGSIVNIGSTSALNGEAAAHLVSYGSVKGFVHVFTKNLAWEWGPKGVRVNTIAPGWIVPEKEEDIGAGSFWRKYGFDMMGKPDDMQAALEDGSLYNMSSLPLKRLGRPEDIANCAMFLCSDASTYITGQLINVGGGTWMY